MQHRERPVDQWQAVELAPRLLFGRLSFARIVHAPLLALHAESPSRGGEVKQAQRIASDMGD
jgi:hypothetical protein